MNRVEELKGQMVKLRDEIDEIEVAEKVKQNKKLVGKCFRYHNSYGSGDKWWLYARVTKLTDYGEPIAWNFQIDCHGKIDIQPPGLSYVYPGNGYQPIGPAEFRRAWAVVLEKLHFLWKANT